jgi:hypothetical protein
VRTNGQTDLYHDGSILKCSEDGIAQILSGKASNESEPEPTQMSEGL